MAKRFTDSDKWKKSWFRKLPPDLKCLWVYICDNCDICGLWDVDFELASVFIGVSFDEAVVRREFEKQFKEISKNKWFIKDFVSFQYGELTETNHMHRGVINKLKELGVFKGLPSPYVGDKDKDIYKDKDKVKDKVYSFDEVYLKYPKKIGRKEAEGHFRASVKSDQDFQDINKAVDNYNSYIQSKNIAEKYIKHASSFFNNWRDWVVMPVAGEIIPESIKKYMTKEK